MKGHPETDPKGLVFESYRIEGITEAECRTIFLDWALSLPDGSNTARVLERLIAQYGTDFPDHPMTGVLRAGQAQMVAPKRRGGWRARPRN
ncbi:MAG: hypothetical protein AB3N11_15670 [Arenibacterium sp.]